MKKFITKNPILNIIIGLAFIAFFLLTYFLTDWLQDSITMIIAALIVIFSTTRYIKDYKARKQQTLLILTGEFAINLALAALLIFEAVSASVAVGFVIYLRGFVFLLLSQLNKTTLRFEMFITYIALLTLGAYILFSGFPLTTEQLAIVLLAIGVAIGAVYLIVGIAQKKNQVNQSSSN